MLLSKDAIADVVEILRADDFYRPAHQMVYEVITDLYGRGEPADAVTVFDELQKRGEMARVGGAAYLHTLTAVVPTAANAGYYAKIVREQAILRRLIEAGTRIVSFGYGGQNEEVDDLVDRAQAEVYKVTERRTSEDYAPLADIMPGALDELEAIGSRSGQMVGVPTGFADLDQLTNGLHPGQMIVVAARPAIGKALALDTPLPTPTGWTTMGQVQIGDLLIDAAGRPTRVVAATGVMRGRPCYEVEFDDGTVIIADAHHQWRTTHTPAALPHPQAATLPNALHHLSTTTPTSRTRTTTPASRTTTTTAASGASRMTATTAASRGFRTTATTPASGASRMTATTAASRGFRTTATTPASGAFLTRVTTPTFTASRTSTTTALSTAFRTTATTAASRVLPMCAATTAKPASTLRTQATPVAERHAVLTATEASPQAVATATEAGRQAVLTATEGGRQAVLTATQPEGQAVLTTEEIAASLLDTSTGRPNHAVPVAAPFQLPPQDVPLPPYALGVWLGDGHGATARISTADPEIIANLEAEGLRVTRADTALTYDLSLQEPTDQPSAGQPAGQPSAGQSPVGQPAGQPSAGQSPVGQPADQPWAEQPADHSSAEQSTVGLSSEGTVSGILRELGVLHDKHIPAAYLRASEQQRRDLLAGLLDTDGHIDPDGHIQLALTNRRLAYDTLELIHSLGHTATMRTEPMTGPMTEPTTGPTVETPACHLIDFTAPGLSRKAARQTTVAPAATRVRHIVDVRPIASRPVRCVEVDNADHLYLAGRACVPTHNSTLGLDFARSAAIKYGMTTVIFSLEMSRNEITMRLLSAEARVSLQNMRSGTMSDDDWTRLARRMSEVAEAPLFIDDSPNMSMMEIRAKCRRLKQRNELRFVVIDYLQLMSSPKKTESRQNEVSEISRAIKLLAKELEVPVIAISQLNRGPEQRTDKRPQVSDLRESGCLTADTRILRADTGAEVSLRELLESGACDIPVWSLDGKLRLVPRTMTHVFPSGTKEVFRLRLGSGREIKATANHPFMTLDGWRPLGELAAGARVAVPRHVSAPRDLQEWPDDEVIRRSQEKVVPDGVFSLPKRQIALFLRHLWATGGCIRWDDELAQAQVRYASTSRRLVDGVARLLLRFNVMTTIEEVTKEGRPSEHHLFVHGADNQLRFLEDIGAHGEQSRHAGRCASALRECAGAGGADTVPREVWERLRETLTEPGGIHPSRIDAGRRATTVYEPAPAPEGWGRIAAVLDDADLDIVATNDVFWDEVASVESLGEQPVFDATVLGTHNFVANGISVHNSIEQDADMVILLHREDAYERESPRAGEADLIVAKHRNGPTATVTVAFQGHYSRFVDMAQH
ncbi:replicative DNA helicase [Nonomuraea fuscirosea]|uniref:replicative DNA helicase n=1 Tax=Nonomuraea fuscirosea TaxID=1291556 RepID=UPI003F4E3011